MSSQLSRVELEILARAAPDALLQYGARLTECYQLGHLIGSANVYRASPVRQIRADRKQDCLSEPAQLAEYIASSIPLHLFDGWCYLGQAFGAQVGGSPSLSIHLAYYAELRAAMSLLATQGIGVFDRQHYVIDRLGCPLAMPNEERRGTHVATWEYLRQWANSRAGGVLIGSVIRPQSIPLSVWLESTPTAFEELAIPIGSDLLAVVGLDLQRVASDRIARNEASYRPSAMRTTQSLMAAEEAEFLTEAVRSFEPSSLGGGFDILDTGLLGRALTQVFQSSVDPECANSMTNYSEFLNSTLSVVLADDFTLQRMRHYLLALFPQNDQLSVIAEALKSDEIGTQRHHLQVLARACLLLRIATGAVRDYFHAADIDLEDLTFWWGDKGRQMGLWDVTPSASQLTDLWRDVADALDAIQDWCESTSGSTRDLFSRCSYYLGETVNLGRIGLMGLAA